MNILNISKRVLSQYDYIDYALLFGSYANGKEYAMSDIDIALYTTRDLSLYEVGTIISDMESALERKIDLVLLNDLPFQRPLLAYNIYLNHRIIFNNNPEAYHKFKEMALHAYMDFKPMIEDQNRAFDQRIQNGTLAKTQTA